MGDDGVSREPDGAKQRERGPAVIRTHGDQAYRNLEGLAEALRAANPEQTYTVDDGAIWLRGEQREWGIYSLYLGSDIPVCCVVDGQTVLHRPAGGAA